MQIIYTKDNINLNYLNNYVKYSLNNNCLDLYNTIYDKEVILKGDNTNLKELLSSLIKGIDTNNLLKIINKLSNKPESLYEYLLQNFIIE